MPSPGALMQSIDPFAIFAAYPEIAADIVDTLDTFVDL